MNRFNVLFITGTLFIQFLIKEYAMVVFPCLFLISFVSLCVTFYIMFSNFPLQSQHFNTNLELQLFSSLYFSYTVFTTRQELTQFSLIVIFNIILDNILKYSSQNHVKRISVHVNEHKYIFCEITYQENLNILKTINLKILEL